MKAFTALITLLPILVVADINMWDGGCSDANGGGHEDKRFSTNELGTCGGCGYSLTQSGYSGGNPCNGACGDPLEISGGTLFARGNPIGTCQFISGGRTETCGSCTYTLQAVCSTGYCV